MQMNIDTLNSEFSIHGQLEFTVGKGGLVEAHIHNEHARAVVSTYAGQVLSFRPSGHDSDLFFVSRAAYHQPGKAIKGGIPVCWPWFGPDPENKNRGSHGFVRNRQWQVIRTEALNNGSTLIVLGISSSEPTMKIWPVDFDLRIEISVGPSLQINLVTLNRSEREISLTQALHSYFYVSDINQVQVAGLEEKTYIDKLDNDAAKKQAAAIRIDSEVDRIYTGVDSDIMIKDPLMGRNIKIQSAGSNSAIVWNPWIDKAAAMHDFHDNEYLNMLCIETANAATDIVKLAPGHSYALSALFSIEPV